MEPNVLLDNAEHHMHNDTRIAHRSFQIPPLTYRL